MRELGIRTVVDLRSGQEVEQSRFNVEAHPVTFHHYPFIKPSPNAEDFFPGARFPRHPVHRDARRGHAPESSGPCPPWRPPRPAPPCFHCTAGKDRTGLLSALVLSLLGVPEETVIAD